MPLRTRILAGVVIVAGTLGMVLVVITRTTGAQMIDQVDDQLEAAVGTVRGFDLGLPPPVPPSGGRPAAPETEPRRLSSLYVGYVDGDQVRPLLAPNLVAADSALPEVTVEEARLGSTSGDPFTVDSTEAGRRFRALAYRDPRTGVIVVLALPLESVDDATAWLVTVAAIGAAAIAVTLGVMAWWVIHLGIRPVKRMTSVAAEIGAGDLSVRVPEARRGTEAGDLGSALNQMLGQIEGAFAERAAADARLRRFVADASHELRTPVATIRGYAELYRTGGLAAPESLDDAMRRTEQESVRMASLVEDLLQLARLDEDRPLDREPVDIAGIAEDAGCDARALDPERPVEVATTGPIVVTGDEARLRQVVANVVGNALAHTPPGTPMAIRAHQEPPEAVIEVSDVGPGMTEEVAARAFERFYRADPARSRHRGGSGLGLAIVDAVVRAHGGSTGLASTPGGGTTVTIRLPVSPSTGSDPSA